MTPLSGGACPSHRQRRVVGSASGPRPAAARTAVGVDGQHPAGAPDATCGQVDALRVRLAALEQQNAQLRLALDAAQAGIWEWDLRTGENRWSESLWPLYGLSPEHNTASYDSWRKVIHPDDREQAERTVRDAAANGAPLSAEWRIDLGEGRVRWLMSRGRPVRDADQQVVRYVGVVIDITEQKRTEAALTESEARNRAMLSAMPDMLFVCDREGVYRDWLASDTSKLLVPPETFLDKPINSVLAPELAKRFMSAIETVLATHRMQGFEYALELASGRRWFETRITAMDADRTLSLVRDITERHHAAELLRQANRTLEDSVAQATQLAATAESANRAKSAFLANMSHEIRTPLNAIIGFARVLSHESELTERQAEQARTIERSGEHLLAIINDILDFAKIEGGRMSLDARDFCLDHLLLDLERVFGFGAAEKGLQFRMERQDGVPAWLHGDDIKLRQVLINLLGNAVKFTKIGSIVLDVGFDSAAPATDTAPVGARLRLAVRDTGPGIPDADLPHLFDAFFQGNSGVEGTGLGLPICRRLVELMGGSLTVETQMGQGSCFRFDLPVSPAIEASAAPPVERPPVAVFRPLTRADLSVLPRPLLRAMRQTVDAGDMLELRAHIAAAQAVDAPVARGLRTLAQRYDYATLSDLLDVELTHAPNA